MKVVSKDFSLELGSSLELGLGSLGSSLSLNTSLINVKNTCFNQLIIKSDFNFYNELKS